MKQDDKLRDKEWLQNEVNNKSLRRIAADLKVSYSRVQTTVKKMGVNVPHRSKYTYTEESRKEKSEMIKFRLWQKYPEGRYGAQASNWRGGMPSCIDCGKLLSRKDAKRCKRCTGRTRRGENNVNWQGGISEESNRIRSSRKYQAWRLAVFTRDNFTCQQEGCGVRSGPGSKVYLEAEHDPPFSALVRIHNIVTLEDALACDALWELKNGVTLCRPCHKKRDTWGRNNWVKYIDNN